MKALLMHRDRDFDLGQELPPNADALMQDLELETLLQAMAGGDEFLYHVAQRALLVGTGDDRDAILYRQQVLRDCLDNPALVREMYALAVETLERKRKGWYGFYSSYPGSILSGAVETLSMLAQMLKRLRSIADRHAGRFKSEGFKALFALLQRELGDAYLDRVHSDLKQLKFSSGVLMSAELGPGDVGTGYLLRLATDKGPRWLARLLGKAPPSYTFHLDERDQAGATILSDLRNRGLNLVANAAAQSAEHVLSYFAALRTELAFYVGCLNLHERLAALGAPVTLPQPQPAGTRTLHFDGLYDACLALTQRRGVVGNAVHADGKALLVITGANQGGKSTFLRSVGLAQLMMQCGMFAAANSFAAELCSGVFTHYKREEDASMNSGKFDEELVRMSAIADQVRPNGVMLFNESFAATNEREGSEIATQVVSALRERGIKVLFVTHFYEFAHGWFRQDLQDALFLRAERRDDGTRTFRLVQGEPLETSFGIDLYRNLFERAERVTSQSAATLRLADAEAQG